MSAVWAAVAVALVLTVLRRPAGPDSRAARLLGIGIAFQALHFAEELATGFHVRFPQLLGLAPWPRGFFVAFNMFWLALWGISAVGLRAGSRPAFFPAWVLALAGAVNGIGHPLLAVAVRGYFPGLFTSPLVGVVGVALWRRLAAITRSSR
jgi:hypothetical protein